MGDFFIKRRTPNGELGVRGLVMSRVNRTTNLHAYVTTYLKKYFSLNQKHFVNRIDNVV